MQQTTKHEDEKWNQKMEPGSEIAENFHVFFGRFRLLEAYKDFFFFFKLSFPRRPEMVWNNRMMFVTN